MRNKPIAFVFNSLVFICQNFFPLGQRNPSRRIVEVHSTAFWYMSAASFNCRFWLKTLPSPNHAVTHSGSSFIAFRKNDLPFAALPMIDIKCPVWSMGEPFKAICGRHRTQTDFVPPYTVSFKSGNQKHHNNDNVRAIISLEISMYTCIGKL